MKAKFSLGNIFLQNKLKILFTFGLVIIELISNLLIPLMIGHAIDDLLVKSVEGLKVLSVLILITLVVGSLRRFYDSRVYGWIYQKIAKRLVESEWTKDSSTSKISARIRLLGELVRFFENSFPDIVSGSIGFIGTYIIIHSINSRIAFLCLIVVVVIIVVYGLTSKKNLKYNVEYNDEMESLVDRLEERKISSVETYLNNMMKINVKMSDLETLNFSVVLTVAMGIFVFSLLLITEQNSNFGQIFALVMYVFDFIAKVMVMPLYYQKFLRLSEISERLSS